MIPVANLRPAILQAETGWRNRLDALLDRCQFILGQDVREFESAFAAATGARHAVGVASGAAAIEISLRHLGITGPVLTSALTAPFSAVAIQAAGATPHFADILPDTLQIDPDDAGNRITRRTAAIVPVHLYGQPCQIARIAALGRPVVQDACQAHGARVAGRALTRFSPYAAYSFYPTKNLGALGDGGAICADNAATARRLREIRDGGRRGGQVSYVRGVNARLDELQACFLNAFLPHLEEWNQERRGLAAFYDAALRDCPGVRLVERTSDSVCHLYVIRARRRAALRRYLAERGIGSAIHYPVPLHLHPAFADAGLKRGSLPHAERACREILTLPLWPGMAVSQASQVADRVRTFYSGTQ
ncbi:MAG: hypothetical protein FJW40_17425 [Acidobacteria bacterium]|nr:hypothetical protein [Acidobacteriota bacterium]